MIYKMKLWQKIFISSLIASILLFAVCGIITTVSGHKRNLQSEEAQAVWMAGRMKEEAEAAYQKSGSCLAAFGNPLIPEDTYFQVFCGQEKVYDGFGLEPEPLRYDFGYDIKREPLEIVAINKVNYLFAEEPLSLGGEEARLVLVRDLSDVYGRCNAQLQTLFLLCGILSVVSAFIMLTASLIITVPIKKINEAVKIVSNNYYA
ncbi:MAG: hypothetical protein LUE94_16270 [Clostridiales bacterium]|nr:hypothetical protein [Clostridiales bacterium]